MELVDKILYYHATSAQTVVRQQRVPFLTATTSPAYTPPPTGECPLLKLPTELRREIFAESLPARDAVHCPDCDDDEATSSKKKDNDGKRGKPTGIVGLMLLNRKLRDEVAEVVYEERHFIIHVHEGLRNGGIEFLQTGRQPLQYQDCSEDTRFWKFSSTAKDLEFGFPRLKKIKVLIYPAKEGLGRHTAINTYLMNLALCRLLERSSEEKSRIKSLTIEFAQPEYGTEGYWWDPIKGKPRVTSIHHLANVELVLRPFSTLTGCHSVSIRLPSEVDRHKRTSDFAAKLERSMMSKDGTLFQDDDLEMKIESARSAMEEHVNYMLHGTKYHEVAKLTEEDMQEKDKPDSDNEDDDNGGGGGGGGGGRGGTKGRKHDRSPFSKENTDDNDSKKQRMAGWYEAAEDAEGNGYNAEYEDAVQQAIHKSKWSMAEEEERQVQEAMNASLRITKPKKVQPKWVSVDYPNEKNGEFEWQAGGHGVYRGRSHQSKLKMPQSPDPGLTYQDSTSPFQGSGRTLGSTASPPEGLGTRDNPLLIDIDDDTEGSSPTPAPAERARAAWTARHLPSSQSSSSTGTTSWGSLSSYNAQNGFMTLYQDNAQAYPPLTPVAYMPTASTFNTAPPSSYGSGIPPSYMPTLFGSSPPNLSQSYGPAPFTTKASSYGYGAPTHALQSPASAPLSINTSAVGGEEYSNADGTQYPPILVRTDGVEVLDLTEEDSPSTEPSPAIMGGTPQRSTFPRRSRRLRQEHSGRVSPIDEGNEESGR